MTLNCCITFIIIVMIVNVYGTGDMSCVGTSISDVVEPAPSNLKIKSLISPLKVKS